MQTLIPPRLVLLLLLGMAGLMLVMPGAQFLDWPWRVAGAIPLVLGAVLLLRGSGLFTRLGTNIKTFDEPDLLVDTDVFAVTRNPMYLGFVLVLAGVAVGFGSLVALLGPVGFAVAADRWYIPFEEARMAEKFGSAYASYRSRVPRWVSIRSISVGRRANPAT